MPIYHRRIWVNDTLSGQFKSGLLLSIANWLKRYNAPYIPKDPSKIPLVLMITQENSVVESVARLFNMTTSDEDITKYTSEEVEESMRRSGLLLGPDNNIDLMIKYIPNKSIDTGDIHSLIEDLEDDGYEVIALVHDYVKRIRAVNHSTEVRFELANIIDEFKVLAQEKEIPVITASQLNREASRTIDAAIEANRSDLTRMLGNANVGESWGMIENADFVCIINREFSSVTNRWYLTFKRIKIRFREISELTYFNHPFAESNKMRLVDDVSGECLSEISLANTLESFEDNELSNNKKGRKKTRKKLEDDDMSGNDVIQEILQRRAG